jgi:ATP adenylyltransferase
MEYIRMERPGGCMLCEKPGENADEENYILHRAGRNFIIMNSFPYNPGHLLIAPSRHVATFEDMSLEELHEHLEVVSRSLRVLREAFSPAGFNVGTNIGRAAGAGIADHVHTHVVPRWQGDTNFMPVLTDTRIVPQALRDTYSQLVGKF